jgi:hypothetical protein
MSNYSSNWSGRGEPILYCLYFINLKVCLHETQMCVVRHDFCVIRQKKIGCTFTLNEAFLFVSYNVGTQIWSHDTKFVFLVNTP